MSHLELREDDYRKMENDDLRTENSNKKIGLAVNIVFIIIAITLIFVGIFKLNSEGWGIVLFCVSGFIGLAAIGCLYGNVKHWKMIRKVMKEKNL